MGLSLSSIGLGTYLGEEDAATDAGYEASVAAALASGINVFDTAINYRGQKSERAIGRALASAFAERRARRATKSSSRPRAATCRTTPKTPGPRRRYVPRPFSSSGIAPAAEIAQGCHCMAPAYLRRPDRAEPREPRPRDDRSLLPAQRRDAARGDRSRGVPRETGPGHRDARGGGGRGKDRRLGPRDLERLARPARASRAPLARLDLRARRRGRRSGAPLSGRPASGQSRDGARRRVPIAAEPVSREGPACRPSRPRGELGLGGLRVGLAPPGTSRGGPARRDRARPFRTPKRPRGGPCSFPGPRRD